MKLRINEYNVEFSHNFLQNWRGERLARGPAEVKMSLRTMGSLKELEEILSENADVEVSIDIVGTEDQLNPIMEKVLNLGVWT